MICSKTDDVNTMTYGAVWDVGWLMVWMRADNTIMGRRVCFPHGLGTSAREDTPDLRFCTTLTASSPEITGTTSFDSVRCWTLEDGQMRGSLVVCLLPLHGLHGNSSWRETESGTKLRLGGQSSSLAKYWVDTCTAGILSFYH